MPRRYTGALDPEDARHGISLMLRNASRLLRQADAMVSSDPPLADFLSATALEELAKAHIIHKEVIHGSVSDWHRFWKGMRSHPNKIWRALFGDMPDIKGASTLAQSGITPDILLARQKYSRASSLYVDSWDENGRPFWAMPREPDPVLVDAVTRSLGAVHPAQKCLQQDMADCCAPQHDSQ